MDGPINGGMLYYEVQELKLCAVHCVNTVLQGPFFSEFDFAALASDLDRTERQMMTQSSGDFARFGGAADESHNVSMGGDFSIQVCDLFDVLGFGYMLLLMMFLIAFEFAKVVVVVDF
ncbi:hypothetical protein Syun_027865 [Stephania yunnanensis]|uniref:ubiquitinyl hydrolase 1 n=1 Tax=Stephania yunnanensis TaxID=152371 RepID=A0AAP0HN73_9MAGN